MLVEGCVVLVDHVVDRASAFGDAPKVGDEECVVEIAKEILVQLPLSKGMPT